MASKPSSAARSAGSVFAFPDGGVDRIPVLGMSVSADALARQRARDSFVADPAMTEVYAKMAAMKTPTAADAEGSPRSATRGTAATPGARTHTHTRTLTRGKSALAMKATFMSTSETSSSSAALESHSGATSGMTSRQRRAFALKRRADEARVQQLRGIFAAYDEDRDGILSMTELANALLSLGVEPHTHVLNKYHMAAPGGNVDLATFIRVTMTKLESFESTERFVDALFREFDTEDTGRVPLSTLLHILCEVDTPSSLSLDEVNEMLRMTGILAELQGRDAQALQATLVDYRALIKHMMFPVPKKPAAAAAK